MHRTKSIIFQYPSRPSRDQRKCQLSKLQHILHFIAPNGSMSSNSSDKGDIRRALIEARLIESIISLPELWN